ncbi:Glycine dehydrogenase [Croceitalea dokdonensis DOKDO 023]|uniref:Glycine dehydrogenase n=1 Tax=Croceitalea dokdonensis DOKDO 023 TaxID=1300341 RepID=A0A0P7AVC9_9FLAO|nr:hypothetical protein [Croceitalea dokdonensis]KPM32547.1 Glycine dehydrogenase [Croceitalea dokdonensis DOKDO 023]
MMISCEKAADICNKSQYNEATTWQIVRFKLHILLCKTCAVFTKKNTKLTHLCDQANLQQLQKEDKEAMKAALKKELQ